MLKFNCILQFGAFERKYMFLLKRTYNVFNNYAFPNCPNSTACFQRLVLADFGTVAPCLPPILCKLSTQNTADDRLLLIKEEKRRNGTTLSFVVDSILAVLDCSRNNRCTRTTRTASDRRCSLVLHQRHQSCSISFLKTHVVCQLQRPNIRKKIYLLTFLLTSMTL